MKLFPYFFQKVRPVSKIFKGRKMYQLRMTEMQFYGPCGNGSGKAAFRHGLVRGPQKAQKQKHELDDLPQNPRGKQPTIQIFICCFWFIFLLFFFSILWHTNVWKTLLRFSEPFYLSIRLICCFNNKAVIISHIFLSNITNIYLTKIIYLRLIIVLYFFFRKKQKITLFCDFLFDALKMSRLSCGKLKQ